MFETNQTFKFNAMTAFYQFLHATGNVDKFARAYNNYKWSTPVHDFMERNNGVPENAISGSFDWSDTIEGTAYWAEQDQLWSIFKKGYACGQQNMVRQMNDTIEKNLPHTLK
jgi:hypothetical protein